MNYQYINNDNEAMENFWKSIDLQTYPPSQDIVHTYPPPQPFDDIDDPWDPDTSYYHRDKHRRNFHTCMDSIYVFFVLLKDLLTFKKL